MNQLAFIERTRCDLATELRAVINADIERVYDRRAQLDSLRASYGFESLSAQKPFAFAGGIAVIPIHGLLVNRFNWSASFATGYDFVRSQLRAALDDADVVGIVYDVNSNGGVVAGCAELAREMFEARGVKPSVAVVNANAYSAAYYTSSAADRVICAPSGGVGSVGCVAMHVDLSSALEHEGVKVTLISEGTGKTDGNMFEPLSDDARESIERDVGYHYDMFVDAVSRHRGVSAEDIRAAGARCYNPPDALSAGLIDGIGTSIDAVKGLLDGGDEMNQDEVTRIASEAATKAVADDRARVTAIRGSAEAQGREKMADHLAFSTDMTVDAARALLAVAPQQKAEEKAGNAFAAVMDMTPNPNVGADNGGNGEENVPNRILANYASLTGRKVRRIEQGVS